MKELVNQKQVYAFVSQDSLVLPVMNPAQVVFMVKNVYLSVIVALEENVTLSVGNAYRQNDVLLERQAPIAYQIVLKVIGEKIANQFVDVKTMDFVTQPQAVVHVVSGGLVHIVKQNVRKVAGVLIVNWNVIVIKTKNVIVSTVGVNVFQVTTEFLVNQYVQKAFTVSVVLSHVIAKTQLNVIT